MAVAKRRCTGERGPASMYGRQSTRGRGAARGASAVKAWVAAAQQAVGSGDDGVQLRAREGGGRSVGATCGREAAGKRGRAREGAAKSCQRHAVSAATGVVRAVSIAWGRCYGAGFEAG